jgi:hypothetical protein
MNARDFLHAAKKISHWAVMVPRRFVRFALPHASAGACNVSGMICSVPFDKSSRTGVNKVDYSHSAHVEENTIPLRAMRGKLPYSLGFLLVPRGVPSHARNFRGNAHDSRLGPRI